jgi:hypothetical protein
MLVDTAALVQHEVAVYVVVYITARCASFHGHIIKSLFKLPCQVAQLPDNVLCAVPAPTLFSVGLCFCFGREPHVSDGVLRPALSRLEHGT